MRENKFRGKAKYNGNNVFAGDWVYGYYVKSGINYHGGEKHYIAIEGTIMDYAGLTFIEVDPETVGQFIGLKDFKRTKEYPEGQEIYEGDYIICKKFIGGNFVDYVYEKGFVEFKHGAFGLHRKKGYYRPFKDWLEDYEYEVI